MFIDLDYKKALSNYNEVENLFKDKLNVSLNKINDYYFALYFLGNQEKGNVLNKEKIEYAKNIFDNVLKKLKEIYVKYQQELENMVSEVSEEKFYSYKSLYSFVFLNSVIQELFGSFATKYSYFSELFLNSV